VEGGRGQHGRLPAAQRDRGEGGDGILDGGTAARGAAGGARRAAGEDDLAAGVSRLRRAAERRGEGEVGQLLGRDARQVLRHQVAQLLVADHHPGLLPLQHLGQRVGRAAGVEVQHVCAGLGERDRTLHQTAAVAGQQAHGFPLAQSTDAQLAGEPVRALVDLPPGEGAVVVHEGEAVRVAGGAGGVAGRRRDAPAQDGSPMPSRRSGRVGESSPDRARTRAPRASIKRTSWVDGQNEVATPETEPGRSGRRLASRQSRLEAAAVTGGGGTEAGADQRSAPVLPLPLRGEWFGDARDGSRALRASWHAERGCVVLSMWRDDHCVGTTRPDARRGRAPRGLAGRRPRRGGGVRHR
jgi:hypothetical protein